uniref:Translation initiation factor eIF2B subunit alpha n=1 Tax=Cacopsylla melanoneura TaxID=428564 RepID=A0A8D9B813_9HEMI
MDKTEICNFFTKILKEEREVSPGIAAIRTLLKVLENERKTETVQELDSNLRTAIEAMKNTDCPVTAVVSGCELFLRFITLAKLDTSTFSECKNTMLHRGEVFLKKLTQARGKVAKLAAPFIVDGSKILVHSMSRVILETIREANRSNKRFQVFVTKADTEDDSQSGKHLVEALTKEGVEATLILDAAVGYIMESVDMVMVGAEGVVESGGIINKIGSYTMAVCARELKKPFYVLAESFKFVRLYPLNQRDLPNEFKFTSSILKNENLSKYHPLVDYTPPQYITLLFTDLGILTPSAISDELIKLYL